MDIKPIRTEPDYEAALQLIDKLFDAEPGTREADLRDVLITLVEAYESRYEAVPLPDPIEAIRFHMDRLGLTARDLEQYIGRRGRVSEVMNRKRPLTQRMMRQLHDGLGISYEVLMQPYPLERGKGSSPDIRLGS
jgi:HTH-type transcriptional regulator/antitoxin HigA